ncbi:4Fe-4S dicluster domain-containing protein [Heliobacillus mobilis]|uniref:4Fe-4S dicluster domain-containing protein n=1 Tax=Heliobacterium mobile TaxID=28064 RepID=A0A6I3SR40_HELMO|nr:4Fe-4S binding protein [Heliobacterium mobile]MTV50862.1 4Fe-4S dicluster domain-containing protein [Heliobacterium mobile]
MAYRINTDDCTACGACEKRCPVFCISERRDGKRLIDESDCINCGACAYICPVECIKKAKK